MVRVFVGEGPWQRGNMLVHERFATADRDDRSVGFGRRAQGFFEWHLVANGIFVLYYAPASDTGQVAGMQRFKHQHKGKVLFPTALLAAHVAAKVYHLS